MEGTECMGMMRLALGLQGLWDCSRWGEAVLRKEGCSVGNPAPRLVTGQCTALSLYI